jgi:hypothetical protein
MRWFFQTCNMLKELLVASPATGGLLPSLVTANL